MKFRHARSFAAFGALLAAGAAGTGQASAKELTLCWAAWDPANALVELSKDFEAKSGIKMKFEFVPWPNFADRMLSELNSGGLPALGAVRFEGAPRAVVAGERLFTFIR